MSDRRIAELEAWLNGSNPQAHAYRQGLTTAQRDALYEELQELKEEKKKAEFEATLKRFDETTGRRNRERKEAKARQLQAKRDKVQAEIDAKQEQELLRLKERARFSWTDAGGDPAEFEEEWPELKKGLLRERMKERMRRRDYHQVRF